MREQHAWAWSETTIGADRDVSALTARLIDGASVLVAGPRGSGRSHLLRAITSELRRHGVDPLVVRPSAVMSAVPFAALDAIGDPRVRTVRGDGGSPDAPPIVVVDDVQLLDPASAAALAYAVTARRAIVLMALAVPRARGRAPLPDDGGVGETVRRLWLDGFADRIDLSELTTATGRELLAVFPGTSTLDAATAAGLLWRADGSRLLLREMVAEAVQAAAGGRDPLRAVNETAPHSRLSSALELHVADLAPEDRECLAFVHEAPRIAVADATRFLPRDVVEGMLSARLLHADDTLARHLTANESLARESQRQIGEAHVDALIDAAGARMLTADDEWWSVPLSIAVAERWHRGGLASVALDDVPVETLTRVALDAARASNDAGDVAHALAHAARGLRLRASIELQLEHDFAAAVLGHGGENTFADGDLNGLDAAGRRRLVRLRAGLADRGLSAPLMVATEGDADGDVEDTLERAGRHADDFEWIAAADRASAAVDRDPAPATRLRALLTAGMAETFAGRWTRAREHFRGVERVLDSRTRPPSIDANVRLGAVLVLLSSYQLAGADGGAVVQRLTTERLAAAREEDTVAMMIAGVAAAVAETNIGRPARALLELETALGRNRQSLSGPDLALAELGIAEALAAAGFASEARAILDRTEPGSTTWSRHSSAAVEAAVLFAEGRHEEAVAAARAAASLSAGHDGAAARLRDLHRLLIADAISPDERRELEALLTDVDLPLARVTAERVAAWEARQSTDPAKELRLHPQWTDADTAASSHILGRFARLPQPPERAPGTAVHELTRRERQIALLVDEGHSNREIAARLFLSVRTVESHVYQARAKVGAVSRNDLGRIVARWAAFRQAAGHRHPG